MFEQRWQKDNSVELKMKYQLKEVVKRMVAIAKAKISKNTAYKLEMEKDDGLGQVFRMARQSQKDKGDVVGIPCIREMENKK